MHKLNLFSKIFDMFNLLSKAKNLGLIALFLIVSLPSCTAGNSFFSQSVTPKNEKFVHVDGAMSEKIEDLNVLLSEKKNIPINGNDIIAGLNEFEKRNFAKANKHFQHALKFDPQNAALHKLNAVSYHMRGDIGDPDKYKLADVGYGLAGIFDVGDSSIYYYRGMLHYNQRNFNEAQDYFARAVALDSTNEKYYLGLAASSYYLGELDRALVNVERAQDLTSASADGMAVGSMVYAALGSFENASLSSKASFLEAGGSPKRQRYLSSRLDDWENYYESNEIKKQKDFRVLMAQNSDLFGVATEDLLDGFDDITTSDFTDGSGDSGYDDDEDGAAKEEENLDMAFIDVTIISSEEAYRSSKGVNLLNGLSLFYNVDTAIRGVTKERMALGLTGDGLTYSLNIFSDANDKNEVLARPSIVVQHGKPSSFFSGNTMHVVLDGGTAGQGSIDQIDDGIRLDVLPEFVDRETITLAVVAERIGLTAALSSVSAKANSPHFAKASKTRIKGNLTLRFGETMILSGLSDQEKDFSDDKVPGLGDIPIVQYFFRSNVKLITKKSILILLTPRRASLSDQKGDTLSDSAVRTPNNLLDLERNSSWMKPSANLSSIVKHLEKYKFFNQFRSGDILLEKWAGEETLDDVMARSLDYFYIKYGS